jgi:hypothetical protein
VAFRKKQKEEFMLFICVEYQTPADDPTLLGSPHTVSRYYEVESKPEAWQIAKHYNASNVKCDASTVAVNELSKEEVERLRAEGVAFHKIQKF